MLSGHERIPSTPRLNEEGDNDNSSPEDTETGPMGIKARNSAPYYDQKKTQESLDFEENESEVFRKHQFRRFFQDRGHFWTNSRKTTAWKWASVVIIGIVVGACGCFVKELIGAMLVWKLSTVQEIIDQRDWTGAFFSYQFFSMFFVSVAGVLCYIEPAAAGGGISEIKAFLNGVNLSQVINLPVLITKLVGMCFAVASGLPIGKKGPIIHVGACVGHVVSKGNTLNPYGYDTSWDKFQDFRNDRSNRDFVTYGAAAGVAAVFRSPIGGVLFALEESSSFWSTILTFRSFVCAMVAFLTVSLLCSDGSMGTSNVNSLFVFGHFVDLVENRTNFRTYEIFIFILLGASGGLIGTLFNYINRRVAMYHAKNTTTQTKRTIHLLGFTFVMACISFLLPLCWQVCTRLPTDEETKNWTVQEIDSLSDLVRFQCHEGYYNQMASLYFCPFDASMRHLFHFREYKGSTNPTFSAAPLILFFLTYFFMAACSAGLKVPMGMFVPSLLAGAAYGRLWGHVLNSAWPGYVADSGTYALMGAAAINGGVTRMTLSMTIIMLETAGNMTYLLPLMVTFGAARYSGNALSDGLYDIGMYLKDLPFLNSSLHTLGLLNFNSVTEIMAIPPVTFNEVSRVHTVYEALKNTTHNGFPILDNKGRLKGLMLRKTLCTLLDLKVFSVPLTKTQHRQRSMSINNKNSALEKEAAEMAAEGKVAIHLAPAGTVFYDRLEKSYPNFPDISRIELTQEQMGMYLDLRPFMDTACHMIHESASVQRCHSTFRTLGLRHIVVVNSEHVVVGIVTRKDLTDKTLRAKWNEEGKHLEKFMNVEPLPPAIVYEDPREQFTYNNFSATDNDDSEDAVTSPIVATASRIGHGNRSAPSFLQSPFSQRMTGDDDSDSDDGIIGDGVKLKTSYK